jgi:hypothetical protein
MIGELEQRLVALGAELEVPSAPDLVPAVLARLPGRQHRARPRRRVLVAVLAGTLLLAGLAMAAPPTRHAILRILGLQGVSIERVPQLPRLPAGRGPRSGLRLGLGERISLVRARHAASFTALLPPGSPTAYLNHDVPGGRISLLSDGVLIIEFRGTATPFIFKMIGPGTTLRRVRVNGGPGVYLSGHPHEVLFQTRTGQFETARIRLAGNVLLWQQGPLTIRIEGTHTLRQAFAMARSLR